MNTTNKIYITASELSEMLGVSMAFSYKICRTLNAQLKDMGFITISGRVPKKYFEEKWYGMSGIIGESVGRIVK